MQSTHFWWHSNGILSICNGIIFSSVDVVSMRANLNSLPANRPLHATLMRLHRSANPNAPLPPIISFVASDKFTFGVFSHLADCVHNLVHFDLSPLRICVNNGLNCNLAKLCWNTLKVTLNLNRWNLIRFQSMQSHRIESTANVTCWIETPSNCCRLKFWTFFEVTIRQRYYRTTSNLWLEHN